MKKSIFILMALAALAMSCNKVEEPKAPVEPVVEEGVPFSFCAGFVSKTVNDGLSTKWVAGDQVSLFNAAAGEAFAANGAFSIAEADLADNKFTGILAAELTADAYDWAAVYPYAEANTSLAALALEIGAPAVTVAADAKTLLAGETLPLFGKTAGVAKDEAVAIQLSHLAAAVKIAVKNPTAEAYTLNKVTVTFPEAVVGAFTVDVTGEAPAYTAAEGASATVVITLAEETTIAAGATVNLYIPVKPYTAAADSKISYKLNDDAAATEIAAASCKLGVIKTINVSTPLPTKTLVDNIAVKGAGDEIAIAAGYTITSATPSVDWITVSGGKATIAANTADKFRLAVIDVQAAGASDNLVAKYYVGQAAAGCEMIFDSFKESELSDMWVGNLSLASLADGCLNLQCANFNDDDAKGQPLYYNQAIALGTATQDVFNKVCITYDFETNAAQCAITVYNDHGYKDNTYVYASDHQWYNSWPNDCSTGENAGNWWCIGTDGWCSMQDAVALNSDAPYTKWMRMKVFSGYDFEGDGVGGNWGGYAIYNLEEDANGILVEKECKFHTAKWWWNDAHKIWENNDGKGGYMGLWTRNHPYFPVGHFRNFTISYENK